MKKFSKLIKSLAALTILSVLLLSPAYAAMNDYCITPPFIVSGVKPNLLLVLDNSASQYDLIYQDTINTYCANNPITSCTPGTTCAGDAYCLSSYTTTTTTTCSAKACTADSQCPNSTTTYKAKPCPNGKSDCPNSTACAGNPKVCNTCDTSTGVGDCVVATYACSSGYCSNCTSGASPCNTTTQDCVATTDITFTPISCTQDSTCSAVTAGDICNNKCDAKRQCYDTTYSTASTYSGYFTTTDSSNNPVCYSYDLTNDKFTMLGTCSATMPGTCIYSAGTPKYICINTSGTPETLSGTDGFVASGNFLNWLTASKFDIQKQILTGGKFDATNNVLIAESRGCAGRKFIKAVSGVDLTFSIRGGTPGGIGSTQSLATEYGQTYIEIYTGVYNTEDCLKAMYDWMHYDSVNYGSFSTDTKGCVGAGNSQYNAVNIWNHILDNCYNGLNDKAQGYSTTLLPLEIECQKAYAAGVAPDTITDPNSGIAICSSILSYVDAAGNPQIGYLGRCWNGTDFTGPCTPDVLTQMENFCVVNVSVNPVIDPSSTVLPGEGSSAPGFIMEQGLMNTTHVGTLTVQIGLTPAPTGLIDKYKNLIRFGAMSFNYNGSESETGSGKLPSYKVCLPYTPSRVCFVEGDCPTDPDDTCSTLSDKDGGNIISYIGVGKCSVTTGTDCIVNGDCPTGETCKPWVGDHTSGLINQIDSRVASTWTPFAEALYNTIGYYTQDTVMRIHSTNPKDFETNAENSNIPNPVQYHCQNNNLLLVTDGMSTADQNNNVMTFVSSNNNGGNYTGSASPTIQTPPSYFGSINSDQLSWYGCKLDTNNICTATLTNSGAFWDGQQILPIKTHVVYSGTSCEYKDNFGSCCATSSLNNGKCATYADEKSVPERLMQLTAQNGGGTYTLAQNPQALYDALDNIFLSIAGKAASGTAASVLASGEGSGANLVQAIFYPSRDFSGTEIAWIGSMKNLWYHLDPFLGSSTIREDTNKDQTLHLKDDDIVSFYFDEVPKLTMAALTKDEDGDGTGDSVDTTRSTTGSVYFEEVYSLWEAGGKLWGRNPGDRVIFTTTNGSSTTAFTTANAATLKPFLLEITDARASRLISYIRGHDKFCSATIATTCNVDSDCPGGETCVLPLRERTITVDLNYDGDTSDTVDGVSEASAKVWKLSDIVNSTPRIASWVPLNKYDRSYGDLSYKQYVEDKTSTNTDLTPPLYKNRGMVFVGANDGMLHAFKLGTLELFEEKYKKATLSGTDIGKEVWAFIPENVLPYLRYFAEQGYCHVYSVDMTTHIVDASICAKGDCAGDYWTADKTRDSWRTILIGGMRLGGACKNACTGDINGDGSTNNQDCVETPASDVGYSSYFALDITDTLANPSDPLNHPPVLLWEFSDPGLGFSTTGPAIVRISPRKVIGGVTTNLPDNYKNGRWFVVLGSGPTGPINTSTHQFMGYSDQNMKLFILDLKTGVLESSIDSLKQNAFAGSMMNAAIDFDQDNPTSNGFYSDDALYFGYTQVEGALATSNWTSGGVLRLFMKNSLYPNGSGTENPAWALSPVIQNIGPVTAAVAKLQNYKAGAEAVRLFFGTGRYFYKNTDQIDDQTSTRRLYGLIEPCYSSTGVDFDCDDEAVSILHPLVEAASAAGVSVGSNWYIPLDSCTDSTGTIVDCALTTAIYKTERNVTDPLATSIGAVFFTTTKPTSDPCAYGGASHLWAVKYDTGGKVPSSVIKGKALLQVSTGRIAEVDLGSAFTEREERRTEAIIGVPPAGSPPGIIVPPHPINKIIHIREK